MPVLGNAAVSRSYACITAVSRGRSSVPGNFSVIPSAGDATASSAVTETSSVATGCLSAGFSIAGQNRGLARCSAVSRQTSGIRGRSTQRPSFASTAGSTVSEPTTATATTRIEPTAKDENTASRARNSPAIEMMTAVPETTTA